MQVQEGQRLQQNQIYVCVTTTRKAPVGTVKCSIVSAINQNSTIMGIFALRTSTNVQQRVHASYLRTRLGVGMVSGEPLFQKHADLLPTRLAYSGTELFMSGGISLAPLPSPTLG